MTVADMMDRGSSPINNALDPKSTCTWKEYRS